MAHSLTADLITDSAGYKALHSARAEDTPMLQGLRSNLPAANEPVSKWYQMLACSELYRAGPDFPSLAACKCTLSMMSHSMGSASACSSD